MPTTRTPIGRPPRGLHITPKAIEAFGRMRNLDQLCTCDPIDWDGAYWKHELCPACEAWWEHHSILWNELSLKPWQWPAIETPGAVTCYPEGSPAAEAWKPDLEAQARYRALETAAEHEEAS